MGMVQTAVGLIERERLTVADIVDEGPNYRTIATEWHLDGELVRRDVAASILCGHALFGEQQEL